MASVIRNDAVLKFDLKHKKHIKKCFSLNFLIIISLIYVIIIIIIYNSSSFYYYYNINNNKINIIHIDCHNVFIVFKYK